MVRALGAFTLAKEAPSAGVAPTIANSEGVTEAPSRRAASPGSDTV